MRERPGNYKGVGVGGGGGGERGNGEEVRQR